MNVQLPEELEEVTMKDILVGEWVYTVPWAMYADENGSLWLNGGYNFEESGGGTLTMKVSRNKDGWIVDIRGCNDRWSKGKPGYVRDFESLPVVKLIQ